MLNWEAISELKGTLVFLMGMKNLPSIVQELMARGYAARTSQPPLLNGELILSSAQWTEPWVT